MPLQDHFHPPLSDAMPWTGFHSRWATAIADRLNEKWLPEHFRAVANIQLGGGAVEIDAATLRDSGWPEPEPVDLGDWKAPPPKATSVVDFARIDTFEVKVLYNSGGYELTAAIELISPGNKDRKATRKAFSTKCANYLHNGVSLLMVDVVTDRHANLHRELFEYMRLADMAEWVSPTDLYCGAFRVNDTGSETRIDAWLEALAIGSNLPVLPLWIRNDVCVPIELEETYLATFEHLRLPRPGVNGSR